MDFQIFCLSRKSLNYLVVEEKRTVYLTCKVNIGYPFFLHILATCKIPIKPYYCQCAELTAFKSLF